MIKQAMNKYEESFVQIILFKQLYRRNIESLIGLARCQLLMQRF
jgi:hypothetical protein